jgi:hypothetical protein
MYWNERNKFPTYSKKLLKQIRIAEKLISENPFFGKITNVKNVRGILVLRYFSIYYRMKFNEVEIVAFWDNRRNPENLEIENKIRLQ